MKLKEALALANNVDRYTPDTGEVDQYHFNEAQIEYIITNTFTAVLDEIEKEVDTAWQKQLSRKDRNEGATAIGLSKAKAIIQSKRTEI